MSRKLTQEEYNKTFSSKFWKWLNGSEDPYLDKLDMKPQKKTIDESREQQEYNREIRDRVSEIYDRRNNRALRRFERRYRIFSVIFCVFLVLMLLTAVSWLPRVGDEDRPANNEVAARYIESGLEETGAVNIVTGMILDYRAFDTLGESHVLFAATCTVLILLRDDRKKRVPANAEGKTKSSKKTAAEKSARVKLTEILDAEEPDDRQYEPKNDVILQMAARILTPFLFIFGIYVILCGHLGPGGGFSGGAVIGSGLILYVSAFGFEKTRRFFNAKTYKVTSFTALACYSLSKCYSFYTGANGIESIIPLGTPGAILSSGLILVLNICVGIVVAGTMYTFYAMFRNGGY